MKYLVVTSRISRVNVHKFYTSHKIQFFIIDHSFRQAVTKIVLDFSYYDPPFHFVDMFSRLLKPTRVLFLPSKIFGHKQQSFADIVAIDFPHIFQNKNLYFLHSLRPQGHVPFGERRQNQYMYPRRARYCRRFYF